MQWLRQLEAQMGMEGVVVPREEHASGRGVASKANGEAAYSARLAPASKAQQGSVESARGSARRAALPVKHLDPETYDVEARVQALRHQEDGRKEKEELDSLLEKYLQVT